MRTPKGYVAVRGDYTGTTDDRRDRWYIDTIGQPVDHRGPGHRTRREAVQMLVDRLNDIERSQAERLYWTRQAPTPCDVCGDTSGRCRFDRACSCWRGIPCGVAP